MKQLLVATIGLIILIVIAVNIDSEYAYYVHYCVCGIFGFYLKDITNLIFDKP